MRYMFLIYTNETSDTNATEADQKEVMDAYNAFTAEVEKRKAMVSGDALQPTTTATTLNVRNGKTLTTDGPYTETKEQLGGFYILNCKDLNEAIELGAKIPGAKWGY